MKLQTRFTAFLTLLSLACASMAATPADEDILAQLSLCDSHFFEALARQAGTLSASPYFVKAGNHAYFKVADRGDPSGSTRRFSTPLKVSGLDAMGYFDENMGLNGDEAFISWGFLLRASVDDVLKATQAKLWDASRLLQEGSTYTRTELWDLGQAESGWVKVSTPGSGAPLTDTIERILTIEAYEKDPTLTRFGCTLQGPVPAAMLKAARPDLKGPKAK